MSRSAGCQGAFCRAAADTTAVSRGTGFLRHMVRILAGTLVEIGLGRKHPSWMVEVLRAKDRTAAGRTAPPEGLTLVEIEYGESAPEWHRGER